MSDQSTKEIEERDRFAPPYAEIQQEQKRLMVEWLFESAEVGAINAHSVATKSIRADLADWIAEETERRIAEDCEEHMPIICGRVKP